MEKWAVELKFTSLIMETAKVNARAVGLYLKNGYEIIPNYGQYAGVESSVCMKKDLQNALLNQENATEQVS